LSSKDAVVLISNNVIGLYFDDIIPRSKLGLLLIETMPPTLTESNFNETPVDDPTCVKALTVILFPVFTVAIVKLGG
jgi:hypothetical protein